MIMRFCLLITLGALGAEFIVSSDLSQWQSSCALNSEQAVAIDAQLASALERASSSGAMPHWREPALKKLAEAVACSE